MPQSNPTRIATHDEGLYNPNTQEAEAKKLPKFKVNLDYTVSSRLAYATE